MGLWNGMWYDLQNGIIMRSVTHSKVSKKFKKKRVEMAGVVFGPNLKVYNSWFFKEISSP